MSLYQAVRDNNYSKIAMILPEKNYGQFVVENFDHELNKLLTPFDLAVKNNNLDILNLLLCDFLNSEVFNYPDSQKLPYAVRAMFLSASLCREEILNFLLTLLISKNFINYDIKNVLLCCACNNNNGSEIIRKAIEIGADINILIEDETPLMIASRLGNIDIVIKLVKMGANIDYKDIVNDISSAIRYAVDFENWGVAEYLLPLVKDRIDKQYALRKILKIKPFLENNEDERHKPKSSKTEASNKKNKKFVFNISESLQSDFTWKYIDLIIGTGEIPKHGQKAIIDYSSFLENGTKLLLLKKIKIELYSDFISKSLSEAINSMHVDSSRRVFIPLLIAKSPFDPFPSDAPGEYLICDIKLHKLLN
jgi:FKBP-type peptidyl-prolyl cis-trans isomerase